MSDINKPCVLCGSETAAKRIKELEAEVEWLRESAETQCLIRYMTDDENDALKAEVERLRALVKSAFVEGMQDGGQGEYDYSPLAVDRCWAESCAKSELEGDA